MFRQGTLWRAVLRATEQARRSGALVSIPTSYQRIEDGGIRFLVRTVRHLDRKPPWAAPPPSPTAERPNPFLPYDPNLYVAVASPTHVCLLNKFNVVDHHLLIVTRRFEPQESPLDMEDFAALWVCLAEYDGLGFYNAGQVAGASQPHKHLQLIPLPLVPGEPAVPIEPLVQQAPWRGHRLVTGCLPFPHCVTRFAAGMENWPAQAARISLGLYRQMMLAHGLADGGRRTGPYNLLVTRRWMLLVPRYREAFEAISLNALAFAGALLVHHPSQLERLARCGPLAALIHATSLGTDAPPPGWLLGGP